jgi:hypothetical protein
MTLRNNQAGFSAFELVLVVLVLGVVAVAGLRLMNANSDAKNSTSNTSAVSNGSSKAPAIKTAKDLDKAQATLDQNDPATTNTSDSKALDTELSAIN